MPDQTKPTGLYCACGNPFEYEPEPYPTDRPGPRNIVEYEDPSHRNEETRFAVFSEARDYYPNVTLMCGECALAVSITLRARWKRDA